MLQQITTAAKVAEAAYRFVTAAAMIAAVVAIVTKSVRNQGH